MEIPKEVCNLKDRRSDLYEVRVKNEGHGDGLENGERMRAFDCRGLMRPGIMPQCTRIFCLGRAMEKPWAAMPGIDCFAVNSVHGFL